MPTTRIQDYQIQSVKLEALKKEIAEARGNKPTLADRLNSLGAQIKSESAEIEFDTQELEDIFSLTNVIHGAIINGIIDIVNTSPDSVSFEVYSGQDMLYSGSIPSGRTASFEVTRNDIIIRAAGKGKVKYQVNYIAIGG
jgi:hypothetical protein